MLDPTLVDLLARIDTIDDSVFKERVRLLVNASITAVPPMIQPVPDVPVALTTFSNGRPLPADNLQQAQEQYVDALMEIEHIETLLVHYASIFPNAAPGVLDRIAMLLVPLCNEIVASLHRNAEGDYVLKPSLAEALLSWADVTTVQSVALTEFAEWARTVLEEEANREYGDVASRIRSNLLTAGLIE